MLFSHVRTGRWASVMPEKLASTLGLTERVRSIPIVEPEAAHAIGLVVPHREPMTPLALALVAEVEKAAALGTAPSIGNSDRATLSAFLISGTNLERMLIRIADRGCAHVGGDRGAGPGDHRRTQGLWKARHLPILHAVQEALGYVPEAAIPAIAEALNVSRAEMHGVVTFYHDFRREPAGRHVLKLCRAEACQSAGARRRSPTASGSGSASSSARHAPTGA